MEKRLSQTAAWLLPVLSVAATLLTALAVLRWLAPGLLGLPRHPAARAPEGERPFFEEVFRDAGVRTFYIDDPLVGRSLPFFPDFISYGPNDVLGFRNRSVPAAADIVVIGDSQTYGNNVPLDLNWPSRLAGMLRHRDAVLYNMSCGGWGAVEYLEMFPKALLMKPRVAVVCFYMGNDSLDSFGRAYGNDRWRSLRPDPGLKAEDAPRVSSRANAVPTWCFQDVLLRDGSVVTFTPEYRLAPNRDHPAVRAGYEIMAEAARRMARTASESGVRIVFTIIPTKETVYRERLSREDAELPPAFAELFQSEEENRRSLEAALEKIPGALTVDVRGALSARAAAGGSPYPSDWNGHPNAEGCEAIAGALAGPVDALLPNPPEGLFLVSEAGGEAPVPVLVRDGRIYVFRDGIAAERNGWDLKKAGRLDNRELGNLRFGGYVAEARPALYGPKARGAR